MNNHPRRLNSAGHALILPPRRLPLNVLLSMHLRPNPLPHLVLHPYHRLLTRRNKTLCDLPSHCAPRHLLMPVQKHPLETK